MQRDLTQGTQPATTSLSPLLSSLSVLACYSTPRKFSPSPTLRAPQDLSICPKGLFEKHLICEQGCLVEMSSADCSVLHLFTFTPEKARSDNKRCLVTSAWTPLHSSQGVQQGFLWLAPFSVGRRRSVVSSPSDTPPSFSGRGSSMLAKALGRSHRLWEYLLVEVSSNRVSLVF